MDPSTCAKCGTAFQLPDDVAKKYPGWKPKLCRSCHMGGKAKTGPELNLTTQEVLSRFVDGPQTGIFSDGSCERNPDGPGGWGVVRVRDGVIVGQKCGHAPTTTNQRMELTALIEAYGMLTVDDQEIIYTDNEYARNIAMEWAATWKKNGWTRGKKHEPIKNLDLVQELHELVRLHPKVRVEWQRGHVGSRWNEYADSLSTGYARDHL